MEKICYLFAAGEETAPPTAPLRGEDLVIAVDGGYPYACRTYGKPHLAVGDFDSLGYIPEGVTVLRHPPEKDDTDLLLALRSGLSRGYRRFYLYGALGGRPDHSYANLQLLSFLAEQDAVGILFGKDCAITALKNASACFPATARGTLSVLAPREAQGVTLTGLRYPLRDATLSPLYPLGVSNEFTGAPATVSVKDGTLLLFFPPELAAHIPTPQ